MIYRISIKKLLASSAILSLILISNTVKAGGDAGKGKALFTTNCASCHSPTMKKDITGPALAGVEDRWPNKENLYKWINGPAAFLATGDKHTNELKAKYGIIMSPFPSLSKADIDDILAFVDAQAKLPDGPVVDPNKPQQDEDHSMMYAIVTLILALIGFILLQVNSSLKKLTDEKEGIRSPEPVPFWRNKAYISIGLIAFGIGAGVWLTGAAIGLGREKQYKPVQPIYYSHKVHAGVNQINCLYCHGGAEQGKHANIPSINICMNCHLGINEYKGAPIVSDDGNKINGSDQIKELYKYAGFDPAVSKQWDPKKGKQIEWVKIHNLPDHVYFNHSQHVVAGKVQCQTCHGPITQMNEVYQFSELSMGWCINCHRETKVQFNDSLGNGNQFYSMYEKFHNDIKSGKLDSVTVDKIGGTECQKCHY